MKINFEKTILPCVVNDVTLWHLRHGFLWDIVEVSSGRRIGVLYCTLLGGDGSVVHFSTVPGTRISPATILAAMRKAIRMLSCYGSVIYATIPADLTALVRCACRLGFCPLEDGGFLRNGRQIILLKYFPPHKDILCNTTPPEGDSQKETI